MSAYLPMRRDADMAFFEALGNWLWGGPLLAVFLAVGLWYSFATGFFPIFGVGVWWRTTVGSLLGRKKGGKGGRGVTQLQALSTALAATVGTGSIAGVATAIVSTKPGDTIRQIFEHQGRLDLLNLVIGGDEVAAAKPDPEGLRLALKRLGLRAEQVLFCGDTVIDAATAQAGGCDFCAVLNGTTRREAFADYPHVYIAEELSQLQRFLKL